MFVYVYMCIVCVYVIFVWYFGMRLVWVWFEGGLVLGFAFGCGKVVLRFFRDGCCLCMCYS